MSKLSSGMLVNPQALRISSATAGAAVGTYAEDETGAGFRYTQNGGAVMIVGNLMQSAPETTTHQGMAPGAAAVGDKEIELKLGATAAIENEYAGGQLIVAANAGEGDRYTIIGHNSVASSGTMVAKLSEPVVRAITVDSNIDIHRNPYRYPVIAPTAETGATVGVALHAIGASEFGWLQTKGPASVQAAEAAVVGLTLVHSTVTAGAAGQAAEESLMEIGYALSGIAASEFGSVYMNID